MDIQGVAGGASKARLTVGLAGQDRRKEGLPVGSAGRAWKGVIIRFIQNIPNGHSLKKFAWCYARLPENMRGPPARVLLAAKDTSYTWY